MTLTEEKAHGLAVGPAVPRPPVSRSPARHRRPPEQGPVWWSLTDAVTLLGVMALAFLVSITVLGVVHFDRDQRKAYSALRYQLANATAPVGGVPLATGTPLVVLDVPRASIRHQVVLEGTGSAVTASGPAHRRDSVLPGAAGASVVFGRHSLFGGSFGQLGKLRAGDRITVTGAQGVTTYQVVGTRTSADRPAKPYAAGGGRLTLVSARGWFSSGGVLLVDADAVSGVQAPAPPVARAAVPADEQAMAGASGAWISVVLWAEAMVLVACGFVWLRVRWGGPQTWIVAIPVLSLVGLQLAHAVAWTLPNLL